MARLRNRIRKADYFNDGELLRWHRDKRATYSGLYALAEDSGCLKDDAFEWKCAIWPSPLDADITVEVIERWRDEFIAAGKLVPYEVEGQRCFFLRSFHKHEHPRNPQAPNVGLPPWITWVPNENNEHRGHYEVDESLISSNGTTTKRPPAPAAKKAKPDPVTDPAFVEFWREYPRKEARRTCALKFAHLKREEKVSAIGVAQQMGEAVLQGLKQKEYVPTPLTFLNQRRWEDWEAGPPAGWAALPAPDKEPLRCWKCNAEMSGDDVLDGVYVEGKGWRHEGCR